MILTNQTKTNKSKVGGKAASLLKLKSAGFNVPDFLILSSDLFDMLDLQLNQHSNFTEIQSILEKHTLDANTQRKIIEEIKKWGFPSQPIAVRSSIEDEDSDQHSFAGMMDSYLNIKSENELWTSISKTAASAYNTRAMAYRQKNGLNLRPKIAVIIQKQVEAISSGVMFTTNPQYPQETAIHSVWGFGEGIVGGHISPDENYVLKSSGKINRQIITEKATAFSSHSLGGLKEENLPVQKQQTASLTDEQSLSLFKMAQQLETTFGQPQDVEFVMDKSKIWLVQSRPITQPIPDIIIYDNSNIQESYCGVTTPLTYSFASRAYATVYRQTMRTLGLSEKLVASNEVVISHLLGLVKGRIYYNINNWYKGLQLLPKFKQNKADMERMMGLTEPVDFIEDLQKTFREKLLMLPNLIVNLLRLLKAFRQLNHSVSQFRHDFKEVYQWYYSLQLNEMSLSELKEIKEGIDHKVLNNWTVPIINDFYVMMQNGQLVRRLLSLGISDVDDFQSRLFSGDHQMENTKPTKEMLSIAANARLNAGLKQLIIDQPVNYLNTIQKDFPDFQVSVDAFITDYGDRTVGELKLETITMRVSQDIFFRYLRNYLREDKIPVLGSGHQLKDAAFLELNERMKFKPWRKRQTLKSIDRLQKAIRNREALRMDRTRLFGMYRNLYLTIGTRFKSQNLLENQRDIFWLNEKEIWEDQEKNWAEVIKKRKDEFDAYGKIEVPSRVIDPSPPAKNVVFDDDTNTLMGSCCVAGELEGECLLVTSPEDNLDVNGKIIVALRTDPGWASLFPVCKAVLIEKGSSLSHSVILLRELGIPSMINIPGLTQRIKSGQKIKMNSKTGIIELL